MSEGKDYKQSFLNTFLNRKQSTRFRVDFFCKNNMAPKIFSGFGKKFTVSLMIVSILLWSANLPALAAAPTVSDVIVTTSTAKIIFDQDVITTTDTGNANYANSAGNLNNYLFESPSGTTNPFSQSAPYNHFSEYYTSGSGEGVLQILNLNLTQGNSWRLRFSNIA